MHPTLFEIGDHAVATYGFMGAMAWLVALIAGFVIGPRRGEDPWFILEIMITLIVAGIVGGRVMFVLQHSEEFSGQWIQVFNLRTGGLVYLGGVLTSAAAIAFHARATKRNPLEILDLLTPLLGLAIFIARWGCFGAGCCYGREAPHLPWAVVFSDPQSLAPLGVPVHPTQIYLSLVNLTLFFATLWFLFRKHRHGQVFLIYLIGYSALRFFVEFFRGDPAREYYIEIELWGNDIPEMLSTSQGLSLVLFAIGVFLWPRVGREKAERVR